jgi:hypothetical protein
MQKACLGAQEQEFPFPFPIPDFSWIDNDYNIVPRHKEVLVRSEDLLHHSSCLVSLHRPAYFRVGEKATRLKVNSFLQ